MSQKKPNEHYVNNKEFTAAVAEHNIASQLAEKEGEKIPQISNYIGECIFKISSRLSTRPNFINYTYRDEMISDGIENCIQYIRNFDATKSDNAFSYFTSICYWAFVRRIKKEQKQSYIKQRSIEHSATVLEAYDTIDGEYDPTLTNASLDWMQENMNPVNYEPRKTSKKKKETEDKFSQFVDDEGELD